jgi:hypothetical protein
MKQDNEKYCLECAAIINAKAEICPSCGVRQFVAINSSNSNSSITEDRWVICILLCWFLWPLGAHRFYSGHITIGILQLITLGGCGIWSLIDFIIIISGNFKDSEGNLIKSA